MGIGSFDYFRKLNADIESSSKLGGALTFVAITVSFDLHIIARFHLF
jgi:hypothetical protein